MIMIEELVKENTLIELCTMPNKQIYSFFNKESNLIIVDCNLNFYLSGFVTNFIFDINDLFIFLEKQTNKTIIIDYLNFYFDQVNNPLIIFNNLWECVYKGNKIIIINHFHEYKKNLQSKHMSLYNKMCTHKITYKNEFILQKNKEFKLINLKSL
ncbi:hypothetical protein TUBRATIS_16690 [Tubulinosema ratisbonensis]|uniref:Uncharacterized protein n=1 Tax=Tubulinosema ratisbonensis TaxID=291195 RepID=A0A437AL77_9MICR|nr:hypothetical protein TUBRATIS_16690 [Tubulinosema ratisbonensis]